jgi:hypothetical protein
MEQKTVEMEKKLPEFAQLDIKLLMKNDLKTKQN